MTPLRALPRLFVEGATADVEIDLPHAELDKLRKVLRLSPGAEIAVLPNDGTVIRCRLLAKTAEPLEVATPEVESSIKLTICQALPKGDKLDEIVRACTEMGASEFVLFSSDRSVVRWDMKKLGDKVRRLEAIAREACEVSFRTRLPAIRVLESLAGVLAEFPAAVVLSEVEGLGSVLPTDRVDPTVVVGPEGGWSPKELAMIGDRGATLGPRVLRVDHAGAAAAAILLLSYGK